MASVVVLAGPSGAGKSRLAQRLGCPVLHLDDFYRSAGDPALPLIASGADVGRVDWDDPAAWLGEEAVSALVRLCRDGAVDVPEYDIARSRRVGTRTVRLDGSSWVVAEGIFAPLVVAPLRDRGLLADAICVTQHPWLTFARRLARDLREHRKPPPVLLRRGLTLARRQRQVVAEATARGCAAMTGDAAYARLRPLLDGSPG